MLTKELIQELNQILKNDYKKILNRNGLVEIAGTLVDYHSLLVKIYNKKQFKDKNNKK